MPRTNSYHNIFNIFVLLSPVFFRYAPTLNVNVVVLGQLFPRAPLMNRRIRFALCPQGRNALSTHGNVEMPFFGSSHRFYYDVRHTGRSVFVSRGVDRECRERVSSVQKG